jgi:hypothetical protein
MPTGPPVYFACERFELRNPRSSLSGRDFAFPSSRSAKVFGPHYPPAEYYSSGSMDPYVAAYFFLIRSIALT